MFADDANIFFDSGSFTELFKKKNEELQEVDSWLIANRLTSNTKKLKSLLLELVVRPQPTQS